MWKEIVIRCSAIADDNGDEPGRNNKLQDAAPAYHAYEGARF